MHSIKNSIQTLQSPRQNQTKSKVKSLTLPPSFLPPSVYTFSTIPPFYDQRFHHSTITVIENVWNIRLLELRCQQRASVHSRSSIQWPTAFGVQRLRFRRNFHRFSHFCPCFRPAKLPPRFSPRREH